MLLIGNFARGSYFYIDDEDFGPLFLKICSYAPWSTKLDLLQLGWLAA